MIRRTTVRCAINQSRLIGPIWMHEERERTKKIPSCTLVSLWKNVHGRDSFQSDLNRCYAVEECVFVHRMKMCDKKQRKKRRGKVKPVVLSSTRRRLHCYSSILISNTNTQTHTSIDLNQRRRRINFSPFEEIHWLEWTFPICEGDPCRATDPTLGISVRQSRRQGNVTIERLLLPASRSVSMITRSRRSTWLSSGWSIDSISRQWERERMKKKKEKKNSLFSFSSWC